MNAGCKQEQTILGDSTVYGELLLIGLNNTTLPHPTKYVLTRRSQPNGLRPGQTYRFHHIGGNSNVEVQERSLDDTRNNYATNKDNQNRHASLSITASQALAPNSKAATLAPDNGVSRIHFTMSKVETVVVDYDDDDKTDLFQIGRAESKKIDFRVDTTTPAADGTSTVSRFAFRILVKRKSPYTARIFAAGFDEANRIVLGENAKKWQNVDGKYDGLVTNGILVMKPEKGFSPVSVSSSASLADSRKAQLQWREVSVSGRIFPVRGQRWIPSKDQEIKKEDNVLADGTLIDLCGATLLWRSRSGLAKSGDVEQLHKNIALLNKRHIICPVQLRTLIIRPHKMRTMSSTKESSTTFALLASSASSVDNHNGNSQAKYNGTGGVGVMENDPFAYLNCGHVASSSLLNWGQKESGIENTCPLCRQVGPLVRLQLGLEPSFYVDKELPTWCFKPCGHACSEQTVKYWSCVSIPFGPFGFRVVCPFCLTPLNGNSPYVRLIFEED